MLSRKLLTLLLLVCLFVCFCILPVCLSFSSILMLASMRQLLVSALRSKEAAEAQCIRLQMELDDKKNAIASLQAQLVNATKQINADRQAFEV